MKLHPYEKLANALADAARKLPLRGALPMRALPNATPGGAHGSSLMDVARGYLNKARPPAPSDSLALSLPFQPTVHAPSAAPAVRSHSAVDAANMALAGRVSPSSATQQTLSSLGISGSPETISALRAREQAALAHNAHLRATPAAPTVRGTAHVVRRGDVLDPNIYRAMSDNLSVDPRHYAPGGAGDYLGQVANAGGQVGLSRATSHSGRDYAAEIADLAKHGAYFFGARAANMKLASSVPGLATPAEQEAEARAQRLVPMPLTGPLADRGYAEVVNSPGAMPPPPPPANGVGYTPEEMAIIMRTALGRTGHVMRDRVDRETLAAGGHLRVASAPWTSGSVAEPTPYEVGGTRTELRENRRGEGAGLDGFTLADMGAGLIPSTRAAPGATHCARQLSTYSADEFGRIAKNDAQVRASRKAKGPDPLADRRQQQRERGQSAMDDGVWQTSSSGVNADASASPVPIAGARP